MPINRLLAKEAVDVYAKAMMDAAHTEDGQEGVLRVRSQMEEILALLNGNMDLQLALSDPGYSPEQRNATAKAVFSQCDPAFTEVIAVMAERGDVDKLHRVFESYSHQVEEQLGLSVVDITTVVPLDDKLRAIIIEKVEADLGKKIVLREQVDKSILGGIIMSSNGRRIDASIASQLVHARAVLKDTSDGGES